jgi:hypothetical protein
VFVRYFIELARTREQVETAFDLGAATWLPGIADSASEHGRRLSIEVGFGRDLRIVRRAEVELGEPIRTASTTIVPLRWRSPEAAGLLPSMDADLEIAALGPDRTQVAMSARYRPPLGAVGRAVDRALLHRVAEATVKDFMDRLRDSLLEAAEATPATDHA